MDSMVFLERIFYKHCNIRLNSISYSVSDASVHFIYIIKFYDIAFVINSNINGTTVCVCKCDDFFIKFICHLGLEFNIFSFEFHIDSST